MKTSNLSQGFTLIELLVVIAIIGILSAVVLASLNTARTKANDASVKSNLNTVATQAELYYATNGQYAAGTITNSCTGDLFSDPTISAALSSAKKANGNSNLYCYAATSTGYAIASPRADSTNSAYWCVDYLGQRCGINSRTALAGYTCGTCITSQ